MTATLFNEKELEAAAPARIEGIQNGTLTVENVETGKHRTFRVKTCRGGKLEGKRIAEVMVVSDNETDYRGFGFVFDNGIKVWQRLQNKEHYYYADIIDAAHKALAAVYDCEEETVSVEFDMVVGGKVAGRYKATLAKRCRCCNRQLTTPKSLRCGYGPECAKRLGVEW